MKKLSIALAILPFLAAGPALSQNAPEDDFRTPQQRTVGRHPEINPDWTWMIEDQAAGIFKGAGYDLVLSLEKSGSAWRGKAMRNSESYHLAVNRYGDVFGHLDKKSLSLREFQAKRTEPTETSKTMQATLNGPVVASISHMAPTVLSPGRPVVTPMGEVGWTWMTQDLAVRLLKAKGYADISSLSRDEHGIWQAKATKNDLAMHVGIDMYGNTEDQPEGHGGVAQASASD
jgi:hypothetical protein